MLQKATWLATSKGDRVVVQLSEIVQDSALVKVIKNIIFLNRKFNMAGPLGLDNSGWKLHFNVAVKEERYVTIALEQAISGPEISCKNSSVF